MFDWWSGWLFQWPAPCWCCSACPSSSSRRPTATCCRWDCWCCPTCGAPRSSHLAAPPSPSTSTTTPAAGRTLWLMTPGRCWPARWCRSRWPSSSSRCAPAARPISRWRTTTGWRWWCSCCCTCPSHCRWPTRCCTASFPTPSPWPFCYPASCPSCCWSGTGCRRSLSGSWTCPACSSQSLPCSRL